MNSLTECASLALIHDQVYSNRRVPTQINTSQHESTRVRHEPDMSQQESDTSQNDSNTSQKESKTGLHHEKEKNMTKRKNVTSPWCGRLHLSIFRFLLKIYDQLNYEALPFYKGIYFIKHCVIIYLIYF